MTARLPADRIVHIVAIFCISVHLSIDSCIVSETVTSNCAIEFSSLTTFVYGKGQAVHFTVAV